MRNIKRVHYEPVEAAQEIYEDETQIVLPKDQWDAFCAALDEPPKSISALKKLLREPSIFDE